MAKNSKPTKTKIRCAIYTRKSSDEGLEQDFNSLDAQREACEAYIKSQKQEGWMALPAHYDDGGLSGGDMDRPSLRRLLADIAEGKIDTVVVYKVDRLTRSLADFSKMVEVFDRHDVAFVAVTQQFNTTTSMGRLTLNMLLSFAQFEREVTAERIRDKIAASKKKGMWMGGVPPLGYDIRDKKLVVNQVEAKTVRHIFERYVDLGSVHALKHELARDNIISKRRTSRQGRISGGKPLARGALYLMLQNPIYRGEISHKGETYPGRHQAIIDQELWDQVQTALDGNRVEHKTGMRARQPSLLAGLVYDDQGQRLVPTHANKQGTRYRYYVSEPLIKSCRSKDQAEGQRLPAGDLEHLVEQRLLTFLASDAEVHDAIEDSVADIDRRQRIITHAKSLASRWPNLPLTAKTVRLQALVRRIEVGREEVIMQLRQQRLAEITKPDWQPDASSAAATDDGAMLTLAIQAKLVRTGITKTLIVDGVQTPREPERSLLRLLAQAQRCYDMVIENPEKSLRQLAINAGIARSQFNRAIRLAYLAPDITKAILQGTQPPTLTAKRLAFDTNLHYDWDQQRKQLGFA